jgi:SpoIIAA-like
MIKLMDGLPDNVIGFEAIGEVSAGDYKDTLDPAVDAALQDHDKLRLVYLLGDQFSGYTGGAMWEDARIGMGHLNRWEKIAVVTDKGWADDAVKLVGWMVPGEVKVYPTEDLEAAKEWASA